VRYRSDERRKKCCKTIELIVEEWPWTPPPSQQAAESLVLMKYILRIGALGKFPEVIVDHERCKRLKSLWKLLTEALAIEEKYEIVITNFLELEKESINASVSEMIRNHVEYGDFFDIRLALNIRLVNLLTSVRLYVDQLTETWSQNISY